MGVGGGRRGGNQEVPRLVWERLSLHKNRIVHGKKTQLHDSTIRSSEKLQSMKPWPPPTFHHACDTSLHVNDMW